MNDIVPCPECHQPARVLDVFTAEHAEGTVRYVRVQCEGPLPFLAVVAATGDGQAAVRRDPGLDGGAA